MEEGDPPKRRKNRTTSGRQRIYKRRLEVSLRTLTAAYLPEETDLRVSTLSVPSVPESSNLSPPPSPFNQIGITRRSSSQDTRKFRNQTALREVSFPHRHLGKRTTCEVNSLPPPPPRNSCAAEVRDSTNAGVSISTPPHQRASRQVFMNLIILNL